MFFGFHYSLIPSLVLSLEVLGFCMTSMLCFCKSLCFIWKFQKKLVCNFLFSSLHLNSSCILHFLKGLSECFKFCFMSYCLSSTLIVTLRILRERNNFSCKWSHLVRQLLFCVLLMLSLCSVTCTIRISTMVYIVHCSHHHSSFSLQKT